MSPEEMGLPSMTSTTRGCCRGVMGKEWWRANSSSTKENLEDPQLIRARVWTIDSLNWTEMVHGITRCWPSRLFSLSSTGDSERAEIFSGGNWEEEEEEEEEDRGEHRLQPRVVPPGNSRLILFPTYRRQGRQRRRWPRHGVRHKRFSSGSCLPYGLSHRNTGTTLAECGVQSHPWAASVSYWQRGPSGRGGCLKLSRWESKIGRAHV